MQLYRELTDEALRSLHKELKDGYDEYCSRNLSLDMSRGKPGTDQLELSSEMMNCLRHDDYISESGIDCRNYGNLDGIAEMKQIFADILDLDSQEVIVGGNSSLSMMFDNVAVNMSHGVRDGDPWQKQGQVKFICPVPGYDRHFAICEYFHIKMIPVPLTADGPDMDVIEEMVESDPMIKGMWCIPVFSNPDGCVYSDDTIRRIARLSPAAPDFRLYWDNAYCIHNFDGERPKTLNILRECEAAGNPNMPLIFTSFSKVSFSGAAVSAMASSKSNCEYICKRLSIQSIGPDKLNQLRHVRFFGNAEGVYAHMEKMADIVRDKFHVCLDILDENLAGKGVASWNRPKGGYFISLDTQEGCAIKTVELCKKAGVIMTPAGATYPYGHDPRDSNIRVAPTFPTVSELKLAMEVFCVAVQLAVVEKIISERL